MPYLVLLIGDTYALRSVNEMGYPVIDQGLFKTLYQGLPSLGSAKWLDLLMSLLTMNHFLISNSGNSVTWPKWPGSPLRLRWHRTLIQICALSLKNSSKDRK